jgi:hypothetical protein
MLLWIESQDTIVIGLLVFALFYLMAAALFAIGAMLARRRVAIALKATTPVMLTPLAVITGLLVAFLASRVWLNVDRANAHVAQEASAIGNVMLYSSMLPPNVQVAVRDAVKRYIRFVDVEDWPAMAEGKVSPRELPPGVIDAMALLLSYTPADPGHQLAQQRAVMALEQAIEARRDRILLSKAVIAPIQWNVVVLLSVLTMATIVMVHIDRPLTAAINLFIFASAIAACLVLLTVNDRPFAAGGITVQPVALRAMSPD